MQNLEKLSVSTLSYDEIHMLSGGQDHSGTNRGKGAVSVEDIADFGAGFICGLFGLCED